MPKPEKSKKDTGFWEYKLGFNHHLGYKEGKTPLPSKLILKEHTTGKLTVALDSL